MLLCRHQFKQRMSTEKFDELEVAIRDRSGATTKLHCKIFIFEVLISLSFFDQ